MFEQIKLSQFGLCQVRYAQPFGCRGELISDDHRWIILDLINFLRDWLTDGSRGVANQAKHMTKL
ncbi:hypothetical protein KIN20_027132, partial [Parelaphostrongylus tenuis]